MEIVSAWGDDNSVFLVHRDEGGTPRCTRMPAKWSAFVTGLSVTNRQQLQRMSQVTGLAVEKNNPHMTRIDFKSRYDRQDVCRAIQLRIDKERTHGWKAPEEYEVPEAAVLEADVMPLRRLLSDFGGIQVSVNPRAVWIDFECDPRKTFQQMVEGEARILCYSLWTADGWVMDAVLEQDTDAAERALLSQLFDTLHRWDLVLSWNGAAFDFPLLENRTKKLRVKMANGRYPELRRWCFLDHMKVYQKYNQAHESGEERSSVSLDAVSRHLLGEGKADFPVREAWDYWKAGGEKRAKLVAYCSRDTKLMPQIEVKTRYIALHLAVCRVTRCLPDSSSLSGIKQGDGFLLRIGAERGYHFPTMIYGQEDSDESFAGAYVMPPRLHGAVDGVDVCDFSGLYPSIMRTWNISHDTLLHQDQVGSWTKGMCRIPSRNVHFRTDIRGILPSGLDVLVEQRSAYSKKSDAAEVDSPDWHLYKRLSNAYKIVNNSMYGIVGAERARFYNPVLAEGVTKTGEFLIKHVASTAEAAGMFPFYGDTDSIFIRRKQVSERLAGEHPRDDFQRVVDSLNDGWTSMLGEMGCPKSYVKLDFEKSYARLVLKSAKCYAGKYEWHKGKPAPVDMKPEIKGLEFKRGDVMRLARQMQAEVIGRLLAVELEPDKKTWRIAPLPNAEDFQAFIDKWRNRLLKEPLAIEDVMQSKSVKDFSEYKIRYTTAQCTGKLKTGGKPRPCKYDFGDNVVGEDRAAVCPRCAEPRKQASPAVHVRVAKMMEARGELVGAGTRIEFLVVKPLPGEDTDGKMVAIPAHDEGAMERVDRDHYWDKGVYPPTERVLDAVYPSMEWRDTANLRKKAVAAAAHAVLVEERRAGKVDDLPLFGEVVQVKSTRVETLHESPVPAQPVAPSIAYRARRPRPASAQTSVVAPGRVVLVKLHALDGEDPGVLMGAIRAAADANPGPVPLKVELTLKGEVHADVRVATALSVAPTRAMRESLARLVGDDAVSGIDA